MLFSLRFVAFAVCGWVFATSPEVTLAEEPAASSEFSSLFNGLSLEGWDGDPRFWRVEGGAIVGQTTEQNLAEQNTFLIYRSAEFADFELRFQYKVKGYNSGIQYRSVDKGNWSVTGYQSDFEDSWHKVKGKPDAAPVDKFSGMFFEEQGRMFLGQRGDAVIVRPGSDGKKATVEKIGSVGDAAKLATHIKKHDWNEMVVIAKGNQFTHIINGRVMAIGFDEDDAKRRSTGILAFQLHKGPPMSIEVKNIRIRVLK